MVARLLIAAGLAVTYTWPLLAQAANEPLAGFLVARYERAYNARDSASLQAVFAPRVVTHHYDQTRVQTREDAVQDHLGMLGQLGQLTLHGSEVAVTDNVVVRAEEWRGLPRRRVISRVGVYRVKRGKIAEIWVARWSRRTQSAECASDSPARRPYA